MAEAETPSAATAPAPAKVGFSLAGKKKSVATASATTALPGTRGDDDDERDDDAIGKTEMVGEMVEGKADVASEVTR
eukprot:4095575-Prymnesium_polylepis.1